MTLTEQQISDLDAKARIDYRWVLGDERGRRVMHQVLTWLGWNHIAPVDGRAIGKMLELTILRHDRASWGLLQQLRADALLDQRDANAHEVMAT